MLPEREERSIWIDGDRLRTEPVPGADLVVDGGWLLPGLVDVHTHPGTEDLDDPFSDETLRRHLTDHRDAGVLLVRTPGSAARIPSWVDEDPGMPRVRSAGRWLATPGRFFPGFGRDVSEADLVQAAVEEAKASFGWCKVIADWKHDEPALPQDVLTAVVQAVRAAGGRVAAHCQTAEGSRHAVEAGVDSLEHGMHLAPELIDRMASQGTAFVPTLSVFGAGADRKRAEEPSARRDWWLSGWEGMLPNVRAPPTRPESPCSQAPTASRAAGSHRRSNGLFAPACRPRQRWGRRHGRPEPGWGCPDWSTEAPPTSSPMTPTRLSTARFWPTPVASSCAAR
ncbi:amidohydrolase family protein [Streptomyces sp. NPDC004393]